jgi:hypothetical protein
MGRRNEKARRAPGHSTARKRRPTNERGQSPRERVKLIMHGGRGRPVRDRVLRRFGTFGMTAGVDCQGHSQRAQKRAEHEPGPSA